MSTNRSPVGRQSQSVYWRRRLAVVGGLVVIIVVVILIVARPGSGTPTPTNSHTPAGSSTTARAPACDASNVQVIGVTDAVSYAAGVDPMISLKITNTGPSACTFKDGSDVQVYEITSGTDKIWSSTDCQDASKNVANVSTLQPAKSVSTTPFAWGRTRSNSADCSATNPPQVVAGGASYHLTVTVNGVKSSAANSPQFILR
ncbi:MAG TPA: hypothetical protein VHZ81_12780 [Galbitalea sp.]|jgi:hypothetical protein|nr:hypothetical protein [Galbitalea sp.]